MLNNLMILKNIPELSQGVSYGLIFIFGLMTSLHCIGMCGGIVMTACIAEQKGGIKPSIYYNAGRVISYTIMGAIVGGLGQIISIQGKAKGIIPIISGLLMILMGINLLGIAPQLKKYLPHLPTKLTKKIYGKNHYGPFYIGLLTGLMPCGPLQTLQMYALGTASSIKGAVSMGVFALGTVPLLFGVGAFSTLISHKKSQVITKLSSAIVIIMGAIMLSQGLAIMGVDTNSIVSFFEEDKEVATSQVKEDYQVVNSEIGVHSFPDITVTKGIPVQWHILMPKENYNQCNKAMTIPVYNIEKAFDIGDNLVEFTPTQTGEFVYTCWMGMIKAHIRVVENTEAIISESIVPKETQEPQVIDTETKVQQTNINEKISQKAQEQSVTQIEQKDDQNTSKAIKEVGIQENKEQSEQQKGLQTGTKASEQKDITKAKGEEAIQDKNEKVDQTNINLEGYLQDQHCFGMITPDQDTKFCLQMEECKASGYGIVVSNSDGENIFYGFSEEDQNKAIEILERSEKEAGVKIKVSGYINGESIQIETIEEIK